MNLRFALLILTAFSSCKPKPTLHGPCDPKELDGLRNALTSVNEADRGMITTIGLGEACESKLPGGLAEGIKALGMVSPADRATIIASVLSENLSFIKPACADWEQLVAGVAMVERAKKAQLLYSGCKYERFDLVTQAEFERSWDGSGFVLLAVPMYAWLVDKNMEPAEARRLARSMIAPEDEPGEAPPAE